MFFDLSGRNVSQKVLRDTGVVTSRRWHDTTFSRWASEDVRNGDLDLENQELSMQLYFALVLVRNVNQGECAVAWRQILGE